MSEEASGSVGRRGEGAELGASAQPPWDPPTGRMLAVPAQCGQVPLLPGGSGRWGRGDPQPVWLPSLSVGTLTDFK